jgi:toxin ParE1/3/4
MSLKWHIRLADQAEQDLLDVIRWTNENFGTRQAEQYAETIALGIEALHDGSEILGAKLRNDIAEGIHTLHVARQGRKGRHFVVFSVSEGHIINVLRLLHDSMDLTKYLPKDDNEPN